MSLIIHDSKIRRSRRTRGSLKSNPNLPRLNVFRSNQHLWAQIIDDRHAKTLVAASTKSIKDSKGTKTAKAAILGQTIATLAIAKKINRVKFDRGPYKYHGRVKALAEAARQAGLKF